MSTTKTQLLEALDAAKAYMEDTKTATGKQLDALGEAVGVHRLQPSAYTEWIDNPEIDVSYRGRILAAVYRRLGVRGTV